MEAAHQPLLLQQQTHRQSRLATQSCPGRQSHKSRTPDSQASDFALENPTRVHKGQGRCCRILEQPLLSHTQNTGAFYQNLNQHSRKEWHMYTEGHEDVGMGLTRVGVSAA